MQYQSVILEKIFSHFAKLKYFKLNIQQKTI